MYTLVAYASSNISKQEIVLASIDSLYDLSWSINVLLVSCCHLRIYYFTRLFVCVLLLWHHYCFVLRFSVHCCIRIGIFTDDFRSLWIVHYRVAEKTVIILAVSLRMAACFRILCEKFCGFNPSLQSKHNRYLTRSSWTWELEPHSR